MHVVNGGLRLIEVLLAIEMHQVQLVDQPQLLQELQRAIYRRPVDSGIALLRLLQERCRIQMPLGVLDDLNQHPSLRSNANSVCCQLLEQ